MRKLAAALATIVMIIAPAASAYAKPVKGDDTSHTNRIDWD